MVYLPPGNARPIAAILMLLTTHPENGLFLGFNKNNRGATMATRRELMIGSAALACDDGERGRSPNVNSFPRRNVGYSRPPVPNNAPQQ